MDGSWQSFKLGQMKGRAENGGRGRALVVGIISSVSSMGKNGSSVIACESSIHM